MTLGTDDLQTAGSLCLIIQLDIGTTACHVRCNRNCSMDTRICHDLRLKLMELCVQHFMLDAFPTKHIADVLGYIDRDCTYQYRLILRMRLFDRLYDCTVLISSHMLSEIELIADDIGILAQPLRLHGADLVPYAV